MRKTITLLTIILFVVFMVGCENSINPIEPTNNQEISLAKQSNTEESVANLAKGGGNVKVELCHKTGKDGKWVMISVDESAVPAHMAHGDMVPNWVITGEWVFTYDFGGTLYSHDYNFDTGTGGYDSGVLPYTHPEVILSQWPAMVCDGGNTVEFTFQYTQDAIGQKGLTLWATGIIADDGSMTGTLVRDDAYPYYPVSWTSEGTAVKECIPCREVD